MPQAPAVMPHALLTASTAPPSTGAGTQAVTHSGLHGQVTAKNDFNKGCSSRVVSAAPWAVIKEHGCHYLPVQTRL